MNYLIYQTFPSFLFPSLVHMPGAPLQPAPLPDLDTMEDGLIFKQCVRDRVVDSSASNQQILASDEETEVQELLAGFSRKEQKRILKYALQ